MPGLDQDLRKAYDAKKDGDKLLAEGKAKEALELYNQAEKVCKELNSWVGLAQTYSAQGYALKALQHYKQAIHKFERSSRIYREYNRELDEAKINCNIALILIVIGEYDKAIALFDGAKKVFTKNNKLLLEAYVKRDIADVLIGQGKVLEGLKILEEVKSFFVSNKQFHDLVIVDLKIAGANFLLGNWDTAYNINEDCKKYCQENNYLPVIATINQNQAQILINKLKFEQAFELVEEATEIYLKLNDSVGYAESLLQSAELFMHFNQVDKAAANCTKAREVFSDLGLYYHSGKADRIEATVAMAGGHFDDAQKLLENAENKLAQDKHELGLVLRERACVAEAAGNKEEGLEYWEKHKSLLTECGKLQDAALTDINIAGLLTRLGRNEEALEHLDKTVSEYPELLSQTWVAYAVYANAYEGRDDEKAIVCYENAVALLERKREDVGPDQRLYYHEDKLSLYRRLIDLLMKSKRVYDAIGYSERSRVRGFFDAVKIKQTSRNTTKRNKQYDDFAVNYELLHNRYSDECNFLYLFQTNNYLYISLFDGNGNNTILNLEINETTLRNIIIEADSRFDATVFPGIDELEIPNEYFNLFNRIAKFILEYSDRDKILVVFPCLTLNFLPFCAIPYTATINNAKQLRYLIEDVPIIRLSSFKMLNHSRDIRATKGGCALVFGNPEPPGNLNVGEIEAIEIAKILNAKPCLRKEATTEYLINMISTANVLHISSHGFYDNSNLAKSGIVFSDRILNVNDILDLDLKASMVSIPCCDTARTTLNRGDDWINVVKAFQINSKSVLASLWHNEEESSKEIMLDFYNYWYIEGLDKARAMQKAQVNFIKKARERSRKAKETISTLKFMGKENRKLHPYYWAGLQLYGDWQ